MFIPAAINSTRTSSKSLVTIIELLTNTSKVQRSCFNLIQITFVCFESLMFQTMKTVIDSQNICPKPNNAYTIKQQKLRSSLALSPQYEEAGWKRLLDPMVKL